MLFPAAKINCKRMANKRAGALIYRVTMDTNDDNKLNQDNAQGEANGMPISYSLETLPVSLETEMKRSYLDYAMSVIVGRALPTCATALSPCTAACSFPCTNWATTSRTPRRSAPVL